MRSGIGGMVRKTLVRKLTTSSTMPPAYAAVMPSTAATSVASAPAVAPRRSDRRAPTTTCENTSLPWSVVPNRWCHDGACFAARRLKSFGWATEMSGEMSAMKTMKATMRKPMRDFGLREEEREPAGNAEAPQPTLRARPPVTRMSKTVGSICAISWTGDAGRGRSSGGP